jgi:L-fuculose-phosphate aldolase
MGNRRDHLAAAVAEVSRRLAVNGWVANHDGNVTARLDDSLLATPTALAKAEVTSELVLTLDMQGNRIAGIGKPFSEIALHLAAYSCRPGTMAVVHAHPPLATARGLTGGDLRVFLPEAVISIGDVVPVARYAMPGAPESVQALQEALSRSDVVMVPGNGAWSVGRDLSEAYLRLELLEHLLKIEFYARAMGPMMEIPADDRSKLLEKRASLGLGPQPGAPAPAPAPAAPAPLSPAEEAVRRLVAEELKKIIQK